MEQSVFFLSSPDQGFWKKFNVSFAYKDGEKSIFKKSMFFSVNLIGVTIGLLWFDEKRNCAGNNFDRSCKRKRKSKIVGNFLSNHNARLFFPYSIVRIQGVKTSNKIIAYSDFSFAIECQWRWEVSPPLRWRRKSVHLQEEIQNQMTFKGREVVTVVQTPEAVEKVQWFQTTILLPVLGTLILTMDLLSKHLRNFNKINC